MFGGFDGTSGDVRVFIYVVSVVMCGTTLTMGWSCELGCIAGDLIGCIGFGVCVS